MSWNRNTDATGIPLTCPMIDWVIRQIDGEVDSEVINEMEKIREANDKLRGAALEFYKEKEELEAELEETERKLNDKISDLEYEIEKLKEENQEYINELHELQR